MINNLLSDLDLAKLNGEQRQFIAERIDHLIDTDMEIRKMIASKLKDMIKVAAPHANIGSVIGDVKK